MKYNKNMKDESFKDYIIDQLVDLPEVSQRKMFGSFGLYSEGKFFAIISDDILYFKTNKETSGKYKELGSDCFRPSQKQVLKNYFEVPVDILEDKEKLLEWAREAVLIN